MARTRKPCTACGVVDQGRGADEICAGCQTLIKEAKAARAKLADTDGRRLFKRPRQWPYMHIHTVGWKDSSDAQKVVHYLGDLMAALSEKDPVAPWDRKNDGITPADFFGDKRDGEASSTIYCADSCFWAKPEQMKLITDLDALLRRLFESSYQAGYRDGQGLLVNLAAGKTSLADFEHDVERVMKEKRR